MVAWVGHIHVVDLVGLVLQASVGEGPHLGLAVFVGDADEDADLGFMLQLGVLVEEDGGGFLDEILAAPLPFLGGVVVDLVGPVEPDEVGPGIVEPGGVLADDGAVAGVVMAQQGCAPGIVPVFGVEPVGVGDADEAFGGGDVGEGCGGTGKLGSCGQETQGRGGGESEPAGAGRGHQARRPLETSWALRMLSGWVSCSTNCSLVERKRLTMVSASWKVKSAASSGFPLRVRYRPPAWKIVGRDLDLSRRGRFCNMYSLDLTVVLRHCITSKQPCPCRQDHHDPAHECSSFQPDFFHFSFKAE
jgi:hypothetical protein